MFNCSDETLFGSVQVLPESRWGTPHVVPVCGQHQRVLFSADDVSRIQENMSHPENCYAVRRLDELARQNVDGSLDVPVSGEHNMDHDILAVIEAKAFLYALTKATVLARDAVCAILNFIRTLRIPEGSYPDSCRAFGYTMYVAGCVYDWCYDQLTEDEKTAIVAGCENLLAPHFEIGMPPVGQSSLVGHGTEAQLLRDWLTLGIAAYDEYPDIYEHVAGRVFHDVKPVTETYLRSGSHWQGSAYGPYRLYFLLFAQHLIARMTGGQEALFSPHLQEAARAFLQYLRPDGQALRIGDDFNERGSSYALICYYMEAFFAACFYGDPVLKGFAKDGLKDFSQFSYANDSLSPVMFLILNQPDVPCANLDGLPRTAYYGSPLGCCITRTAWNDPDAAMVYMKIGESYTANHEHKDAGSFQIYCHGILASNSGLYDSYFTPHDIAYNKQSISVNSLLLINPDMQNNGRWVYSGGQRIQGSINEEHRTLASWEASDAYRQAKILSHAANDIYCCLCGDLTWAYDDQTAEKVVRRMLSVFTQDKTHPVIFAVYDDIITVDACFRKVFLLHAQQEPTLTADGFAIVENTREDHHGRLVVQSCGDETEMHLVTGCQVNGEEPPLRPVCPPDSVCEIGWGRIEISPRKAERHNRLLTLMYAGDANSAEAPIRAETISTAKLQGAAILGHVLLFCRDDQPLQEEITFVCPGSGEISVLLCGAAPGAWHAWLDGMEFGTYTVQEDEQLLAFNARPGVITLIPHDEQEESFMKMPVYLFAATRYWQDAAQLTAASAQIAAIFGEEADVRLVVDGDLTNQPESLESAVIIPLSGAVQRSILILAERCGTVILYAGYCAGNFPQEITDQLLTLNAAPTLMDTWGVIHRSHSRAMLAVTHRELLDAIKAVQAVQRLRGAKVLMIGETEPWVVSNASSPAVYEAELKIQVERISPEEMICLYEETTDEEAQPLWRHFAENASAIVEPTADDLRAACRFGAAMVKLLEKHQACGAAIACFDLIKRTGVNACLGAAYINDVTHKFIACEGDMDSAVTMLLLRGLTDGQIWMANPCLDESGMVNFSHCTAPCHIGSMGCPYTLRNHHETGVGVSVDVSIPADQPLTLCRISDECSAISIHTGRVVSGNTLNVCRTQIWVQLDDYPHYLETALGCHQVFVFERIESRVRMAAKLLGLTIA